MQHKNKYKITESMNTGSMFSTWKNVGLINFFLHWVHEVERVLCREDELLGGSFAKEWGFQKVTWEWLVRESSIRNEKHRAILRWTYTTGQRTKVATVVWCCNMTGYRSGCNWKCEETFLIEKNRDSLKQMQKREWGSY